MQSRKCLLQEVRVLSCDGIYDPVNNTRQDNE